MELTKLLGGGENWYYLIENGRIIGAAHEDDKEKMNILFELFRSSRPVY